MNRVKLALSGFGAGAAFMYLSDPDRGKRRRALARDQAVKTWNDFSGLVDKAQRDLVKLGIVSFPAKSPIPIELHLIVFFHHGMLPIGEKCGRPAGRGTRSRS